MKLILFSILCILFGDANAQNWEIINEQDFKLEFQRYTHYEETVIIENEIFIITKHDIPEYWKKNRKSERKILISKLNHQFKPEITGILSENIEQISLRYNNDKYYILDLSNKYLKGSNSNDYYLRIYDHEWNKIRTIHLVSPGYFYEIGGFQVNDKGDIFLFYHPSGKITSYRSNEFIGSYLYRISEEDEVNHTIVDKIVIDDISIQNGSIQVSGMEFPYNSTRSYFGYDFDLKNKRFIKSKEIANQYSSHISIDYDIRLNDTLNLVSIDSMISLGEGTYQSIQKLSCKDSRMNSVIWEKIIPGNYGNPVAVSDGFIIENGKEEFLRYDLNGNSKIIRKKEQDTDGSMFILEYQLIQDDKLLIIYNQKDTIRVVVHDL